MRRWAFVALVALVPVALLAVVRPDRPRSIPDGATSEPAATTMRVPPSPREVELDAVRDIFRFEDEEAAEVGAPVATRATPSASTPEPPAAPEVRLVGLVRRGPRLLAALALADDVFVLGVGESAAGYAVLDVSEDGVRLRGPEGEETTLALP